MNHIAKSASAAPEANGFHSRHGDSAPVDLAVGVARDRFVPKNGAGSAAVGRLGNHPGVSAESVGRDADSVVVPIRRLHGVPKDETMGVGGQPRLAADVQLQHRIAGHRHQRVEFHFDFNRVPELVGSPRWAPKTHETHSRGRGPAAVDSRAGVRKTRAVDEVRVGRAVGSRPDRPAVEPDGVGADANSVVIPIRRLNRVPEGQYSTAGTAGGVRGQSARVADDQCHLWTSRHRHRSRELDAYRYRLPAFIGAVVPEVDTAHRRRADAAAVDFASRVVGDGVVRQDGIGSPVCKGRDLPAFEAQGTGLDADAVSIEVGCLNRVPEGQSSTAAGVEQGLPGAATDGQRHLRSTFHGHGLVEVNDQFDVLTEFVGVTLQGVAAEGEAAYVRRGEPAAFDLAARVRGLSRRESGPRR